MKGRDARRLAVEEAVALRWVHCVAAKRESDLSTGARVRAVWADETVGYITDIRCFEPV